MERVVVLDGIPLIGYLPWSGIDIVSTSTGEMLKHYGFIYVDLDDMGRGWAPVIVKTHLSGAST